MEDVTDNRRIDSPPAPLQATAGSARGAFHISGNAINPTRDYILERWGTARWNQLLTATGPDAMTAFSGALFGDAWYPLPVWVRVLRTSVRDLGQGDEQFLVDMTRWSSTRHWGRVLRFVLHFVKPEMVLEQTSRSWRRFFDRGSLSLLEKAPKHAVLTLTDFLEDSREICICARAGMVPVLEQSMAQSVTIEETKCRHRDGGDRCEFTVRWA